MQQEKKNEPEENNSHKSNSKKEIDLKDKEPSMEVKNANAAGLGALGRSDETIEKPGKDNKGDQPVPY